MRHIKRHAYKPVSLHLFDLPKCNPKQLNIYPFIKTTTNKTNYAALSTSSLSVSTIRPNPHSISVPFNHHYSFMRRPYVAEIVVEINNKS